MTHWVCRSLSHCPLNVRRFLYPPPQSRYRHFHHHKHVHPATPSRPSHPTAILNPGYPNLVSISIILSCRECSTDATIHYICSAGPLPPLSTVLWGAIQFVICPRSLFLYLASNIRGTVSHWVSQSPTVGSPGWFPFGTLSKKAGVNVHAQVFGGRKFSIL